MSRATQCSGLAPATSNVYTTVHILRWLCCIVWFHAWRLGLGRIIRAELPRAWEEAQRAARGIAGLRTASGGADDRQTNRPSGFRASGRRGYEDVIEPVS
ncbi:hypothetical protein F5Y07DRAFT_377496 [Xylaria sp. FL0933]|nr:hypothetical protein F5Y07DRAFT_377496 [Xylaria sp. FL0933]